MKGALRALPKQLQIDQGTQDLALELLFWDLRHATQVVKRIHLGLLLARQTMKIKLEPAAVGTRAPRGKDSLKKGPHFGPQFGAGVCTAILK